MVISVIIPTLNAAQHLPASLPPLFSAMVDGVVCEVIISDGESTDHVAELAQEVGAGFIRGPAGRGRQLAAGAARARGRWLLFLHADTVLSAQWHVCARRFMGQDGAQDLAGYGSFQFDRKGVFPTLVEWGVALRCAALKLPYGDQALLVSRPLYEKIGGHKDLCIFEDVELVQRIVRYGGRRALRPIGMEAVTSAARYEKDGYARRIGKNLRCLCMYYCGLPVAKILKQYR